MITEAITGVSAAITSIVNAAWPNPEDKAKGEAIKAIAEADAAVKQLQAAQAVMLAEAQSSDPWTSRARPSFLYVVYLLLLMSLPMGVIYAIDPLTAANLTEGMKGWFEAIPKDIIELFQWVMLGYIGGRSAEKVFVPKMGK
jgi:hypothetical protein